MILRFVAFWAAARTPGAGAAGTGAAGTRAAGTRTAAEPDGQVLVLADLAQMAGEQIGERDLVQVVILAGRQPRLDRDRGLLGELREHVVGAQ